ncbi:MAG TPA: TlpA disulfide reductase family protein [Actinomycetota bacterium]|nr:TlpA disulfide reductase family protein [Actinomycetota bacterium]
MLQQRRRRQQWRVWGTLAAVVAALAIVTVATSLLGTDRTEVGEQTQPVSVAEAALPRFAGSGNDPAIGMPAPSLAGESFDGTPVTIDPGSTGSPTAIWFVAHWCPHCQAEVPGIVSLSERGRIPEGIDVYAVSTSSNPSAPNYPPSAWLAGVRWPFPTMADDGRGSAGAAYGLGSFPFLVITDGDGNVIGRHEGELGEAGISQMLRRLANA